MKKILKKFFSKIVSLSKWLTLASVLAWFFLSSFNRNPSRPVSSPAVPYSIIRQQEQEAEQQDLKILEVRNYSNQPFYDYKVPIFLEDEGADYDVIRIDKFIDYEKDYNQIMLHPIFKDEDLNMPRESFAKRHLKRKIPQLVSSQLLTKLANNDPLQEIYTNLPLMPEEVHRRFLEFQNQMLKDYCFSFYLGKVYNRLEIKQQSNTIGESDYQTKYYYLTEARMHCISLELTRLGASIVKNLIEMQNLVPDLNRIQKVDLDVYYSHQVYKAALEAYDAQAAQAQRNLRLKRAKRAFSLAGLTFAGLSVVGGLFSFW